MNIFIQNYCRICFKFFCCVDCRLKHEKQYHSVYSGCDICIYGKAILRRPDKNLLEHIKMAHLPLHCIYCNETFSTNEELIAHPACLNKKTNKQENLNMIEIPTSITEPNYESPPVTMMMHKSILTSSNKNFGITNNTVSLTTSTPMQKSNERDLLETMPKLITTIDYSDKSNSENFKLSSVSKSNITPTSEQSKHNEPKQRKVTFCETPSISTPGNKENVFSELSEKSNQDISSRTTTNNIKTMENYIKVKCVKVSQVTETVNFTIEKNNLHLNTPYHNTNNETYWESAIMDDNIKQSPSIDNKSLQSNTFSPILNENSIGDEEFKFKKPSIPNSTKNNSTYVNISYDTLNSDYSTSILPSTSEDMIHNMGILQKHGMWTSMANIVKSVVQRFLGSDQELIKSLPRNKEYTKRLQPENDPFADESPVKKKIKLTNIQCRKTIHNIRPLQQMKFTKKNVKYCDKWTQTD